MSFISIPRHLLTYPLIPHILWDKIFGGRSGRSETQSTKIQYCFITDYARTIQRRRRFNTCRAQRNVAAVGVANHGHRTDIGLGSLALVSLAKARELAESMRSIARNGEDPLAQRRAVSREIPTFAEAAQTVHGSYSQGWKNPKLADQWIN